MTDAIICDRCGSATDKTTWNSGLRAGVQVKHLSPAATSNRDYELALCESCTEALHLWLGRDLPQRYKEKNGYEAEADE